LNCSSLNSSFLFFVALEVFDSKTISMDLRWLLSSSMVPNLAFFFCLMTCDDTELECFYI
jgi:hypothetical protein